MKILCKKHELALGEAMLKRGIGSEDAMEQARSVIFAQARANEPGRVVKALRAAQNTPQACLVCCFDAPEWIEAVADDVGEFRKGHLPAND